MVSIPNNAPLLICPHKGAPGKVFFVYLAKERAGILLCSRCSKLPPSAPGNEEFKGTWLPTLKQAVYRGAIKKWATPSKLVEISELPKQLKGQKRKLMQLAIHDWYADDEIDEFDIFQLYSNLSLFEIPNKVQGLKVYEAYQLYKDRAPVFATLPEILPILVSKGPCHPMYRHPDDRGKGTLSAAASKLSIFYFESPKETGGAIDKSIALSTLLHEMTHSALAWAGHKNYFKHDKRFLDTLGRMYLDTLPIKKILITPKELKEEIEKKGSNTSQALADIITMKATVCIYENKLFNL